MKHNFEERKQNRIDYAKQQSEKQDRKGEQLYNHAKKMASAIPFGQPIMVGHSSENRDRNYRNKIHTTYGKAFESYDKSAHYAQKAKTIASNTAIYSDDPQALVKLREKLDALQALQKTMIEANKCVRKNDKGRFMQLPGATAALWEQLITPDFLKRTGYPKYRLQNNNATISQTKKRIAALERTHQLKTTERVINGVRLVENVEANRVQLLFPTKPEKEIRIRLRKSGFNFCSTECAWQRQLNPWAVLMATRFLQELTTKTDVP